MATNTKLVKEDGSKPVDHTLYQSIMDSLQYASTAIWPDISYFVRLLSKFNAALTETHMTAAKCVLSYLKGAMDLGIIFSKYNKPAVMPTAKKIMKIIILHQKLCS